MKWKFKNNILFWGAATLGGVFILASIIPITLNFVNKDKVSAKFDNKISFTENTKYGKYYDAGTDELQSSTIDPEKMNQYWIKHAKNTEMQLGEIIYGISKFIPTLSTAPTYSYECTIYNYQHRILQINSKTQIFQFKFWYAINFNYHPKNPYDQSYNSGYRFYIDWTTPEFLNDNPQPGLYNILYSQYYTFTPVNNDWELRFTNYEVNSYSLVFANQEFSNG